MNTPALTTSIRTLGSIALLGLALLAPRAAEAGVSACGDVYVTAEASCEWVAEQETCTTECQQVEVYKSCAARLYTECEGMCSATSETTCTTECGESCVPECDSTSTEEQPPNCMGLCMSDCQMDCNAACAEPENTGACRASCAHTCQDTCHDRCDGEETVECEPVCTSACEGSCTGRANIDCQVSCQASEFVTCETEVVEQCTTKCEQEGGALFCDGEYIANASAAECVSALKAEFDIDVNGWAEGECVDPEGAKDVACEVKAGLSCSVDDSATRGTGALATLGGLLIFGLFGRRRRS